MSTERLERLEARLAELEARMAIMDLESRYATCWDGGDAEGWAALYTADGCFDLAAVGQQERQVFRGREALAEFCRQVDGFYKGLHYMHLPQLELRGEDQVRARIHFQWTGMYAPDSRYRGERRVEGYYDVHYRKVGGQWLIEHRLEKAVAGVIADGFDVYLTPQPQSPA